jgi:hypothetical protein
VYANGGTPAKTTKFAVPGYSGQLSPAGRPLPGDRGVFLRAIWYEGGGYHQGIGVLDPRSGKAKILIRDGGSATYHAGVLFFSRLDALFAVRFDPEKLELKGAPVGIMNGLRQERNSLNARFGVTPDGTLIYLAGGNALKNRHLVMVDRQGNASEWSSERRPIEYDMKASPDGNRAVLQVNSSNAITELWISERGQPASRRVPSRPGADCIGYTWSQDSRYIAFSQIANDPTDGIYVVEAGAALAPRMIVRKPSPTGYLITTSWSPDRSTLLTTLADSGKVMIWAYKMPAKEGDPVTRRNLFSDDAVHGNGVFSPDGRVMAYQSTETGKAEVYACGWAGDGLIGQPIMVSRGGGEIPRWGHDGKHLYYSAQGKLMSTEITSKPTLSASPPILAWNLAALRVPPNGLGSGLFDILPDGRLLAVQGTEEEEIPSQFNLVLNFDDVVKQRMRAAGK